MKIKGIKKVYAIDENETVIELTIESELNNAVFDVVLTADDSDICIPRIHENPAFYAALRVEFDGTKEIFFGESDITPDVFKEYIDRKEDMLRGAALLAMAQHLALLRLPLTWPFYAYPREAA